MPRIHQAELVDLLLTARGSTFVTITTTTEVDIIKPKSNPYAGRLRWRVSANLTLNADYKKSVNRQREREGKPADFVPAERTYGVKLEGVPLLYHKGKLQIVAKKEKNLSRVLLLDGAPVLDDASLAVVNEWVRPFRPRDSGRQGVDEAVEIRNYPVENIEEISIFGAHHTIIPAIAAGLAPALPLRIEVPAGA